MDIAVIQFYYFFKIKYVYILLAKKEYYLNRIIIIIRVQLDVSKYFGMNGVIPIIFDNLNSCYLFRITVINNYPALQRQVLKLKKSSQKIGIHHQPE